MLTDYDIQRLSSAIVDNLVNNEKFIRRVAKILPKEKRMGNTTQAAKILGVTRKTVCEIAPYIGGIKMGSDHKAHWIFPLDEVAENYITYKQKL